MRGFTEPRAQSASGVIRASLRSILRILRVAGSQHAVKTCLEKLAESQRVALEMAYFEGMSQTEIASALNQPLGTMKDRIRSGMMHLRKCLKPYEAHL